MTRRIVIVLAVWIVLVPSTVLAQSVVVVVRHAERADAGMAAPPGADPDLSPAGRSRAEALATLLKDAGITAIYVTEFKRTRQTAEPLAKLLGIEPTVVSSKDAGNWPDRVKTSSGTVLIVGHSNTVPAVIKALGGEPVTIDDSEFDNLFILTGPAPTMLRLHYR